MSKKSIYRNRNATANFVNLIRTSTVHGAALAVYVSLFQLLVTGVEVQETKMVREVLTDIKMVGEVLTEIKMVGEVLTETKMVGEVLTEIKMVGDRK